MTNISVLLSKASAIFELIVLTVVITGELRISCCIGQRLTRIQNNSQEDFRNDLTASPNKTSAPVTDVSGEQQQSPTSQSDTSSELLTTKLTAPPVTNASDEQQPSPTSQIGTSSTLLTTKPITAPVTNVSNNQQQNTTPQIGTSSALLTTEPIARNCTVYPWSGWSDCTGVCGAGVEFRSRAIDKHAAPGGMCRDLLVEQRPCGDGPECPKACKDAIGPYGKFGNWSGCRVRNITKRGGCGFQVQNRYIQHPSYVDKRKFFLCGQHRDSKFCENSQRICPRDLLQLNGSAPESSINRCYYNLWSRFGPCSRKCGKGKAFRKRRFLYKHPNRTKRCKNTRQAIDCELEPCIKAPPLPEAPESSLPVWVIVMITVVTLIFVAAIVITIIYVVMKMRKRTQNTEKAITVLKQKRKAAASSSRSST